MDDLISRQAAIDALRAAYWDDNIQSAKDDPCIVDAMTDWAIRQVKALPPSQPEPCEDAVSRQRLLSDLKELVVAWEKYPVMAEQIKGVEAAIGYVKTIPNAKPESDSGRWERHYSRPGVYADLCWHCSKCGYKTDYQYAPVNHRYCPNCGRKMEREVTE